MNAETRKVVSTPHRNRATFAADAKTSLKSTDLKKSIFKLGCGSTHFHIPMEATMTKAQAMKEAKARWGRQAYIRDARRPSSNETRAAALATLESEFGPRPEDKSAAREWWAKARRHPASFDRCYRRYAVGYTDDIFGAFHVRGEGDTWAEAIEKAGPPSKVWA